MFTARIVSANFKVIVEDIYDKNGLKTDQQIELIHAVVEAAYTDVDTAQRICTIRRLVSKKQAIELTRLLTTGEDVLLYNVKNDECGIISDGDEV